MPTVARPGCRTRPLEPLNAPLREIAVRVSGVGRGSRVLDVGCGTGTQLERYAAAGCDVAGIDTSPAMLARARERLGSAADLRLADAQRIPFQDAMFDVVTATLVLHELRPLEREAVGKEMARVLTDSGRMLVIDFSPGPLHGLKGWGLRGFSVLAELTARHLERSRTFLAEGGVPVDRAARHGSPTHEVCGRRQHGRVRPDPPREQLSRPLQSQMRLANGSGCFAGGELAGWSHGNLQRVSSSALWPVWSGPFALAPQCDRPDLL